VLTESLAWTITGLTLGGSAGSAVAGWAVDHWGAESAFAVPATAAALAAVLALCGAPLLRVRADTPRSGHTDTPQSGHTGIPRSGSLSVDHPGAG
jgi:hypothetical protein